MDKGSRNKPINRALDTLASRSNCRKTETSKHLLKNVSEEKPDEDKYSIRDKKQHILLAISSNQTAGRHDMQETRQTTSKKSFIFCPLKAN